MAGTAARVAVAGQAQIGSARHVRWVNEKNIANIFREAAEDGATLLIDEVDGLLQDRRRRAVRNREVTAVNEMLACMGIFHGGFIASTNLTDGFDRAALRRFDLKVRLTISRGASLGRLLCRQVEALGLPAPALSCARGRIV
ncbi:AAA family ATPase [Burkholderia sp. WAC0059]|uniref:AAA family ATPase n=1 Tax=Burkholderia sp. WAC0059 TaxID=2066022 RepID=UPI0035B5195D